MTDTQPTAMGPLETWVREEYWEGWEPDDEDSDQEHGINATHLMAKAREIDRNLAEQDERIAFLQAELDGVVADASHRSADAERIRELAEQLHEAENRVRVERENRKRERKYANDTFREQEATIARLRAALIMHHEYNCAELIEGDEVHEPCTPENCQATAALNAPEVGK